MRRLRIGFKWLAIVVGSLLTAALLISALRSWRAGACLAEQLSSIRQAGDPVSLADLAREQVPPDRNAATFLRRAEKSLDAVSKELSPLGLNYDSYYEQGRPTEHGHLNERGAELVEGAISAYPDILPLLEQAAAAPDYVPDYDYTRPPEEFLEKYLPCTSQHRQVARFLQYRGDMLFAAQKREESLANGLVLLRLDRHFEREPMSIGYLVSCAIRTRLQCLSVLNALSRLAGEPDGEKRRLDDLDLSGEIKVDPYTGQPLKIKHAGAGWVVYSVGGNLKDDGGNIDEGEDVGVGPDG